MIEDTFDICMILLFVWLIWRVSELNTICNRDDNRPEIISSHVEGQAITVIFKDGSRKRVEIPGDGSIVVLENTDISNIKKVEARHVGSVQGTIKRKS